MTSTAVERIRSSSATRDARRRPNGKGPRRTTIAIAAHSAPRWCPRCGTVGALASGRADSTEESTRPVRRPRHGPASRRRRTCLRERCHPRLGARVRTHPSGDGIGGQRRRRVRNPPVSTGVAKPWVARLPAEGRRSLPEPTASGRGPAEVPPMPGVQRPGGVAHNAGRGPRLRLPGQTLRTGQHWYTEAHNIAGTAGDAYAQLPVLSGPTLGGTVSERSVLPARNVPSCSDSCDPDRRPSCLP